MEAGVGLVLLSTVHGLAALVIAGIVPPEHLAELLSDSIDHVLRGSRTSA